MRSHVTFIKLGRRSQRSAQPLAGIGQLDHKGNFHHKDTKTQSGTEKAFSIADISAIEKA
jgi:hypothetical protein